MAGFPARSPPREHSVTSTCAARPDALEAHCRQQAELLLVFPQCADDCRALARRFLLSARK
jgi:hypothetical protein